MEKPGQLCSDNCSVMIGRKNSVLSRIKEKKPDVFDLGCVCHLANLCAVAGIKALEMPVEDLLIDIYYHFNHRLVIVMKKFNFYTYLY